MVNLIGITGLLLLIGAFVAGLSGHLATNTRTYLVLNGLGAGILAWYSFQLGIWIFVILESVWSFVAWVSLVRLATIRSNSSRSKS